MYWVGGEPHAPLSGEVSMGIRPRGQRELGRDQELEEAEEDPLEIEEERGGDDTIPPPSQKRPAKRPATALSER
jgi:hypothetical protein